MPDKQLPIVNKKTLHVRRLHMKGLPKYYVFFTDYILDQLVTEFWVDQHSKSVDLLLAP